MSEGDCPLGEIDWLSGLELAKVNATSAPALAASACPPLPLLALPLPSPSPLERVVESVVVAVVAVVVIVVWVPSSRIIVAPLPTAAAIRLWPTGG